MASHLLELRFPLGALISPKNTLPPSAAQHCHAVCVLYYVMSDMHWTCVLGYLSAMSSDHDGSGSNCSFFSFWGTGSNWHTPSLYCTPPTTISPLTNLWRILIVKLRRTRGDEQQQARMIYSHQKCVWEVRSGCESSAKASNGWDTSEIERTGGPGHTGYSTYTYRAYCSTQDNKVYTKGK